jgi:serine protease Do
LGDSDALEIGDWVLALGQPFGLQDTVTHGIISAKNRGIGITKHAEFLQTDAAINPGNSGGPLVNLRGEVVGVNTAISSTSGGYPGIGFAVPANVVKWVVPQLLKDGKVHRAFLGVGIQMVDQALAEQLGMSAPAGAVVTDVQPKSPAGEAGLQSQDVIVEFAGTPVQNPRQLQAIVSRSPLGVKQPVVVLRDGKRVTLQVVVREAPANYGEKVMSEKEAPADRGEEFKDLGLELAPLNKDVAEQLGLKEPNGVVIVSVAEGSPAAAAGLRPSQAIVQVGRSPVKNVEEFKAAVKTASLAKGVLLLVRTEEGSRFVVVKGS